VGESDPTYKSQYSPQSISIYAASCLRGAEALPITGNGYQVMQLSRVRFYGHPDLLGFIENG